jgi:RNA polymerase subunit RPABC4/transcription elongation factor Spt4
VPRYDRDDDDLPEGVYHDDEWQTVPCKYCRAEMAEGVEQCPKCGEFQSAEDAPMQSRSWFIIVCMIFALLCALFWAIGN